MSSESSSYLSLCTFILGDFGKYLNLRVLRKRHLAQVTFSLRIVAFMELSWDLCKMIPTKAWSPGLTCCKGAAAVQGL